MCTEGSFFRGKGDEIGNYSTGIHNSMSNDILNIWEHQLQGSYAVLPDLPLFTVFHTCALSLRMHAKCSPKHQWSSNKLHNIIFQQILVAITAYFIYQINVLLCPKPLYIIHSFTGLSWSDHFMVPSQWHLTQIVTSTILMKGFDKPSLHIFQFLSCIQD
jgi:hypothetical protein